MKNTGEHDKRLHQPGTEVCKTRGDVDPARCMRAIQGHFLRFIQVNKLDDDCAKAAACKSTCTGIVGLSSRHADSTAALQGGAGHTEQVVVSP